MKKLSFRYLFLLFALFTLSIQLKSQNWQMVWSDEFSYTGLPDANKWSYDVGGSGWGNNELQYYTQNRSQNARVENGNLIIEARKEAYSGMNYTSARLVTKNKGDWTYGKMEIRAKLPAGRGSWPAIWMLPTTWNLGNGSWPDNGEIDIMEHVGYDQGWVHGSIHCNLYNHVLGTQKTAKTFVSDCSTAFHVYTLIWTSSKISVLIDNVQFFSFFNNSTGWQAWPFYRNFHLLLNIAVGGNWGGVQGVDDNIFPIRMEVDYVRVYKDAPAGNEKIEGNGLNRIKVNPNPSQNSFNIKFPYSIEGKKECYLLTSQGKLIEKKQFYNNENFDIENSNLSPGIYFIKIITENEIFSEKLIKI